MKLICESRCGRGAVRSENQDNLFVNGSWRKDLSCHQPVSFRDVAETGIYAVCDGMGGEHYGEEASLIAVQALAGVSPESFFRDGAAYLSAMNRDICRLMRQRGARIGTTFVGLTVSGDQARIINIGDSRAYLLRSGRMVKLSRDHTQAQRLVNMGIIPQEQASSHPDRHKLTQHLGIFPEELVIEPYVSEDFALQKGDIFLLCSDGLTDMLTEQEISLTLQANMRLADKADRLYQSALRQGGKDNITVVLVQTI